MATRKNKELFDILVKKGTLKQQVYSATLSSFHLLREVVEEMHASYQQDYMQHKTLVPFDLPNSSEFEFKLKFAGDVLIFCMHTNVFEFPRDHEVMKTAYIKKDKERSYCGIIHIFNFLADSIKYNRGNDIGYLIGRIFINKDMSYFIEGKKEIGMLYPNFGKEDFDRKVAEKIVESAMLYTINFDLLTPNYDSQVQVSIKEMQSLMESLTLKTGKRLGFKFQADREEGNNQE